MFNKVILVGNLTRDIELRYLPNGTAVGSTGLATNRRYRNQMGEQKEEVCFIDITFFGRTAEIANQYLKRGSKVLVEGRLKFDQWSDQMGQKRSKHSVVVETLQMLDPRTAMQGQGVPNQPQDQGFGGGYSQPPHQPTQQNFNAPKQTTDKSMPDEPELPSIDLNDDEIPF